MPDIRPSADLRNNYNEISRYCNERQEPIFITKNGRGDLAVMSMELFNQLSGKQELYRLINAGIDAMNNNDTIPYRPYMDELKQRIKP